MGGVPRSCAERALERIAWRMQWGRRSILGGESLYEILAAVRDNREFRLGDLKDNLVRSGLLATAGEDGIRFRYESLQAYYAARYLAAAPDRQDLIEDITASLGHVSRARWWENTLVTMAGLPGQSSEGLLQAILAGSTLVEGDQVYLASRCFLDTRTLDTAKADGAPAPVVDQIVDALIWRSHPGNLRPYADRKRAATALAELRHPNAIPHLVSLASEELATGWGTEKRYEFSGIRLIAVNGLMLMQDAANAYVLDKRPALANVLTAWRTAYEHGELSGLIAELQRGRQGHLAHRRLRAGVSSSDQDDSRAPDAARCLRQGRHGPRCRLGGHRHVHAPRSDVGFDERHRAAAATVCRSAGSRT